MKNSFRLILYFFLILIIISGILFLIFNDEVNNYLQNSSNLEIVLSAPPEKIDSQDTINTKALNNPHFQTLINNVVNFNFDNICWRPDTILSRPLDRPLVGTSSSSTILTPLEINCHQGNGLPFVIKKTK